jgi:hypothetical protein
MLLEQLNRSRRRGKRRPLLRPFLLLLAEDRILSLPESSRIFHQSVSQLGGIHEGIHHNCAVPKENGQRGGTAVT